MTQFIQLHLLTSYPPANLNRDDLGRPKTARMGGVERLRVSSQSLKRAWRTSDLFGEAAGTHMGTRTRRLGTTIFEELVGAGVGTEDAKAWARRIAAEFGELRSSSKEKPDRDLEIEQLAHVSPVEWDAVRRLVHTLSGERREPKDEELRLLRERPRAVDIALFGRMLAAQPRYNVEASVQVAHAISVHPVVVEDDYFTAVDDLNKGLEDAGAGHVGEAGYAAAVLYLYVCINRDLLLENLEGDAELADRAVRGLTEAASKIPPSGKQASFASRAYASYVIAEKGPQQPRSLSVAFLRPIVGSDVLDDAIARLEGHRERITAVYGPCCDHEYAVNAYAGTGNFSELSDFVGT